MRDEPCEKQGTTSLGRRHSCKSLLVKENFRDGDTGCHGDSGPGSIRCLDSDITSLLS